jgi:hypothetical protein
MALVNLYDGLATDGQKFMVIGRGEHPLGPQFHVVAFGELAVREVTFSPLSRSIPTRELGVFRA